MKDSLCFFLLVLVFLPSLYYIIFNSLNPLIDVGKYIYCQHDEKKQ